MLRKVRTSSSIEFFLLMFPTDAIMRRLKGKQSISYSSHLMSTVSHYERPRKSLNHQAVSFPTDLKPSMIRIPPADPPTKPGHKREHSSPNSITFETDVSAPMQQSCSRTKEEIFSPRVQHTVHKSCGWRCVSPTDQFFRVEQPSIRLKRGFVRRFLSEVSEAT